MMFHVFCPFQSGYIDPVPTFFFFNGLWLGIPSRSFPWLGSSLGLWKIRGITFLIPNIGGLKLSCTLNILGLCGVNLLIMLLILLDPKIHRIGNPHQVSFWRLMGAALARPVLSTVQIMPEPEPWQAGWRLDFWGSFRWENPSMNGRFS